MRTSTTALIALLLTTSSSSVTGFHSHTSKVSQRGSVISAMNNASTAASSWMEAMSLAVAEATGKEVELAPATGGGAGGGGGASISAAVDKVTNNKYFIKSANVSSGGGKMLKAEYEGVKEMEKAGGIRVPSPVAYGEYNGRAFVVFEYLNFCSGPQGAGYEMGKQLAKMHRYTSENGQFGFHIDNTIGATPQPNTWVKTWPEFWDEHRLKHMLDLTGDVGCSEETVDQLRAKTKELLSQHNPEPSLIHGDLWGGNAGYAKVVDEAGEENVVPVIFDPATYYGDREADIAMTYLFGGFRGDFYEGYESEWPLPPGHEKRKTIYNLYHILNHEVLFGGAYGRQAKSMIEQILRF